MSYLKNIPPDFYVELETYISFVHLLQLRCTTKAVRAAINLPVLREYDSLKTKITWEAITATNAVNLAKSVVKHNIVLIDDRFAFTKAVEKDRLSIVKSILAAEDHHTRYSIKGSTEVEYENFRYVTKNGDDNDVKRLVIKYCEFDNSFRSHLPAIAIFYICHKRSLELLNWVIDLCITKKLINKLCDRTNLEIMLQGLVLGKSCEKIDLFYDRVIGTWYINTVRNTVQHEHSKIIFKAFANGAHVEAEYLLQKIGLPPITPDFAIIKILEAHKFIFNDYADLLYDRYKCCGLKKFHRPVFNTLHDAEDRTIIWMLSKWQT